MLRRNRVGRVVLHGIAAYYVLFAPRARRYSRAYLRRALGRRAGWADGFRHVLSFASTIHDRIYLLNDRFDLFEIEIIGAEALHAALARQPGALLIGAHLGSFEVLRAVGRGWADAIDDPAGAITSLVARNPAADPALETERLQMAIDANVLTDYVRANGIGGIDAARMARAIEQTKSVYQFAAEPDAALFFDASFLPTDGSLKID